mmetsp:Transcript_2746/g.9659  ORF Transcript_2746/g.9659 Transcript_2746/m.9659 type:complete len:343 (-) Transcript_2746:695-1723(-)
MQEFARQRAEPAHRAPRPELPEVGDARLLDPGGWVYREARGARLQHALEYVEEAQEEDLAGKVPAVAHHNTLYAPEWHVEALQQEELHDVLRRILPGLPGEASRPDGRERGGVANPVHGEQLRHVVPQQAQRWYLVLVELHREARAGHEHEDVGTPVVPPVVPVRVLQRALAVHLHVPTNDPQAQDRPQAKQSIHVDVLCAACIAALGLGLAALQPVDVPCQVGDHGVLHDGELVHVHTEGAVQLRHKLDDGEGVHAKLCECAAGLALGARHGSDALYDLLLCGRLASATAAQGELQLVETLHGRAVKLAVGHQRQLRDGVHGGGDHVVRDVLRYVRLHSLR